MWVGSGRLPRWRTPRQAFLALALSLSLLLLQAFLPACSTTAPPAPPSAQEDMTAAGTRGLKEGEGGNGRGGKRFVFFIGFNKTGTRTFCSILAAFGRVPYHRAGWTLNTIPLEQGGLGRNKDFFLKNKNKLWGAFDGDDGQHKSRIGLREQKLSDVWADGEGADFEWLDRTFPNSVFILNTRPLDQWLLSRCKHVVGAQVCDLMPGKKCRWISSHTNNSPSAIGCWVWTREQYHKRVLAYFGNGGPEDEKQGQGQGQGQEEAFRVEEEQEDGIFRQRPRRGRVGGGELFLVNLFDPAETQDLTYMERLFSAMLGFPFGQDDRTKLDLMLQRTGISDYAPEDETAYHALEQAYNCSKMVDLTMDLMSLPQDKRGAVVLIGLEHPDHRVTFDCLT